MRGRIKEDDSGVPMPDGPFAYSWKYREGGQHELIGRTPRDGGDFQTILDGDALAKASDYFKFGGTPPFARPSARSLERRPARLGILHHPRAALGHRRGSARHVDPDRRQRGVGRAIRRSSSMSGSTRTIGRCKVFRHRLGTPQSDDVLVYEEKDAGWFTHIEESASGRFCIIAGGDHDTSEQRLVDLSVRTRRRA